MAKKQLTISEFREIIKEEAVKLKKKMVLEAEKKALENELKTLSESFDCDDSEKETVEELFGASESRKNKLKDSFVKYSKAWRIPMGEDELENLMKQAAEDNFKGRVVHKSGKMAYNPSTGKERAGGFGGHAFGSGI